MNCISLAILSRLSRFTFPAVCRGRKAVGTNYPFCIDVPLNKQSINHSPVYMFFSTWQRRSSVHEKKDAIASREMKEEAERLHEAILQSTKDEDDERHQTNLSAVCWK